MALSGELDTAHQCLKRGVETLGSEWDSRTVRLRIEDIKRARGYLRDITKQSKEMSALLRQFEGIATTAKNVKITKSQ